MNKLNALGIGPKIAIFLLPRLTISIILSRTITYHFEFSAANEHILFIAGIVLMVIGLIFYFATARILLKGLKETRLMTKGMKLEEICSLNSDTVIAKSGYFN